MAITKVIKSDSKQFKPILKDTIVLDTVPTVGSFNGVTSDGVAQAISSSGNVPTPAAGDTGKVLTANNGSYEWADPTGTEYTAGTGISISDENAISVSEAVSSGAAAGSTAVQPGDLAAVATSGSYDDLTDKPTIPSAQVNSDWNAESGVAAILNKPSLATVATSGSYTDLSNKPNIPEAQVNSDWSASTGVSAILNKPDLSVYAQSANLATVATSGDYADLTNKPTIPAAQVQSNWAENDSSSKAYIQNKPDMTAYAQTANLATVAVTGDYADLLNKPALATVATSGSYADLSNKPSIPAAQVNADWDAVSGVEQILNKPNLATVATTGSYNDLQDKPTIPSAVTVDQHYDSLSANPQSGVAVAEAIAGTGQVPTVTSSDDNKVLMASYSGGVGSFAWEPSAAATQVNSDWNASSGVAAILNKPDLSVYAQTNNLATVAISGSYNDLSNRPSIPAAQVNSDWEAASGVAQILNKPVLATVATSGDYADLTNKPAIPAAQVQANWNESDNTSKAYIQNKPDLTAYAVAANLATVATTGDYDDLTNKPSIPAAQVNSDWNESSSSSKAFILNKPNLSIYAQSANLATVATSGSYNDLSDKPTIPAAVTVDQTYSASSTNAQSGVAVASAVSGKQDTINDLATIRSGAEAGATAVQPGDLATVATTGSYDDLTDKPTIPAAQVNSDWNAASGISQILNKPTLAAVATSGSYADLSNKPTIPTVDQSYSAASTNAQSGTAVAQAIAAIPSAPTYTAGEGIAISAQNAISAKVGGGVTIGNASSTASVTDNLSVTPIRDGNVRFYPIFGRLNADTANALANGSVTIKTLVSWNDAYNHPNYRPGIFIYNASWGYNKYTAMMFGTNSISGSIPANTEIVYDISDVNSSLSNLTIETILANPTNYVFFALPCDSSGNIDWNATYGSVTSSTAAAVISTATYQSTVTVPNSIILENPLPASAVGDAGKVLTVDNSGAAAWTTPTTVTVDQTYNSASANAQSGTAVAGALATVRQVPTLSGAVKGQVLSADGNGGSEWGSAILDVPVSMMGPSDDLANDILQCVTYGTKQVFLSDPVSGYKLPLVSADFNGQGYTLHDRVFKGSATLGSTVYTIEVYWLPDEEGEGADAWSWTSSSVTITNIQQVNALPANPDANTLYLIPEA